MDSSGEDLRTKSTVLAVRPSSEAAKDETRTQLEYVIEQLKILAKIASRVYVPISWIDKSGGVHEEQVQQINWSEEKVYFKTVSGVRIYLLKSFETEWTAGVINSPGAVKGWRIEVIAGTLSWEPLQQPTPVPSAEAEKRGKGVTVLTAARAQAAVGSSGACSGGYYKYRCKYFFTHNCPYWVWVHNAPCAHCLVLFLSLTALLIANRSVGRWA